LKRFGLQVKNDDLGLNFNYFLNARYKTDTKLIATTADIIPPPIFCASLALRFWAILLYYILDLNSESIRERVGCVHVFSHSL